MLSLLVSPLMLDVMEGSTNSFTVRLTAEPASNIVVSVARTSGTTNLTAIGTGSLTFTPVNWNTPQTVNIAGAHDANAVPEIAAFTVSADGIGSEVVTVTELDDDVLALSASSAALAVPEGGTNTLTVVLTAQPTNNVTVNISRASGSTNLSVAGSAALTFTPVNWNTSQNVSIQSANDLDAVPDAAVFNIAASGLTTLTVAATQTEKDTMGLVVSASALTLPEGATTNLTVRLSAQPTNNVSVLTARTSGSTNLNVTAGGALTFTPSDWNTPKPVSISSSTQPEIINDVAVFTVSSAGLPIKPSP